MKPPSVFSQVLLLPSHTYRPSTHSSMSAGGGREGWREGGTEGVREGGEGREREINTKYLLESVAIRANSNND